MKILFFFFELFIFGIERVVIRTKKRKRARNEIYNNNKEETKNDDDEDEEDDHHRNRPSISIDYSSCFESSDARDQP